MLVEDGELRVPGAEQALASHRAISRVLQGLS
jgi:hypothetical protein